jgi:hypothetical protein
MTPQATKLEVLRGGLTGSPPYFLLVAWESYMSLNRTTTHFYYSHPE